MAVDGQSPASHFQPHKVRDDTLVDKSDVFHKVTQQLSSRLGRLKTAEDGHPHFYGATSNLHLQHNDLFAFHRPHMRTVRMHGDTAVANASLEWQRDPAYEDHLIRLFFAWHNPLTNVVDKSAFLHGKNLYENNQVTQFYSPTLDNAM